MSISLEGAAGLEAELAEHEGGRTEAGERRLQQIQADEGGQQQPQGWNRPQQSFGQPAWPQQPGGYPQGGRYQQPGGYQQVPTRQPGGYPQRPGYQQPGQFNRAPQGRNPLSRILVTLVVLCGVLLAAIVVSLT